MWILKRTNTKKKKKKETNFSTFPIPCYGIYWFLQVTLGGARAKQQHSTIPVQKSELRKKERQLGHCNGRKENR